MSGRARDYRTIGEVVESLSERYPELTVSKLRFLEEEGLISPARTPGGYRKFAENDVARVEMILRMQQEHFLPLAVIRDRLADLDKGRMPAKLRSAAVSIESTTLPIEEALTIGIAETQEAIGVPPAFVAELARFGLVEPVGHGEGAELTASDVEVAVAAWDLRKYGVEPRHLKMFDQFAEREASLFAQVLMPAVRLRTPEARQQVVRQLEELVTLTDDLKRHLLKRALGETFEDVT